MSNVDNELIQQQLNDVRKQLRNMTGRSMHMMDNRIYVELHDLIDTVLKLTIIVQDINRALHY